MKAMKMLLLATAATSLAALSANVIGCGGDDNKATPPADAGMDVTHPMDSGNPPMDSGNPMDTGTPTDAGTDAPTLPTGRIDRMGRPAINTALNFHDNPNKDKYNQELTFQDWTANLSYAQNFNTFLHAYDTLGGLNIGADGGPEGDAGDGGADQVDWPFTDAGISPLYGALINDFLVVDISKDCTAAANNNNCAGSYLDVELDVVFHAEPAGHKTCGGRTLGEDIVDKTLTLLITGLRAPIGDGVSAATKPPTATFPYLAAPN